VCPLDTVDGILNNLGICNIHAPVVIQVVHLPVAVIIDEDVVGISVHMAAEGCPASGVASARIVLGCPEAAHDSDASRIYPVLLEILEDELVLVHQLHVDDDVFGPDVLLIVRQEVLELEVLGELGILVLGSDFDEAARRIVIHARSSLSCRRPVPYVIEAESAAPLLGGGTERNHAEIRQRLDGVSDAYRQIPCSRPLRSNKFGRGLRRRAGRKRCYGAGRQRVGEDLIEGRARLLNADSQLPAFAARRCGKGGQRGVGEISYGVSRSISQRRADVGRSRRDGVGVAGCARARNRPRPAHRKEHEQKDGEDIEESLSSAGRLAEAAGTFLGEGQQPIARSCFAGGRS
jgi:hypothetical protein